MLVSLNWLKEFVDIDISANDIAEALTMGGIEVESVTHVGKELSEVLTARVQEITEHPSASKLRLVKIDLGGRGLTVVCGAPNVEVGQIVPYAGPGVILPSGFVIEAREIKGVSSPGMLCSEKELGLGDDASGLLVLDASLKAGLPLTTALPFVEDFILETSVTPNRGDCLSVLGTARDLAALLGKPWTFPEFKIEESDVDINDKIVIEVPDYDLCPRYVARMVEGVKIAPSPLEVRVRLSRSGVRPISNVVDVTNLVLLEMGQPLHAFDYNLLEDRKIVVRRCDPGETFTTLDGQERKLPENTLMIRDGKRSVALAGIMGGLNSEIVDATTNVLIESACFEPFGIRRSSKTLGLSTEASYRFERGIDPDGSFLAAGRCAYLMKKYAGGSIAKGSVDAYPDPIKRQPVVVRPEKVNTLLGIDLQTEEMASHLRKLTIEVRESGDNAQTLVCTPPSWRWDLEREVDMAEEVARILGFQNIPISAPRLTVAPDFTQEKHGMTRRAGALMNASGYSEIITMSFITREAAKEFDLSGSEELALMNPLTEEYAVMRKSLVPGLISVMKRNVNFRNEDLKLYEIGRTFVPVPGAELPREDLKLGFLAVGARLRPLWNTAKGERVDFYDLKGALENLLEGFGIEEAEFVPSKISFLHPGKSADVLIDGENIGFIGELSPVKAREHEMDREVYISEVFLEPLFAGMRKERVFTAIPRYPYIERDLSFIVEEKVSGAMIKRLISHLGHDIITSVNLFDLYRGESIPQGHQSMAFRIRYQSEDRTLTDEEVQEVHSLILEALSQEFGASIRE
jgi:phenylalanyl-tRNA synthetase beta chain